MLSLARVLSTSVRVSRQLELHTAAGAAMASLRWAVHKEEGPAAVPEWKEARAVAACSLEMEKAFGVGPLGRAGGGD